MDVTKKTHLQKMFKFSAAPNIDQKTKKRKTHQPNVGLWVQQDKVVTMNPYVVCVFKRTGLSEDHSYVLVPDDVGFKRLEYSDPWKINDEGVTYSFVTGWEKYVHHTDSITFSTHLYKVREYINLASGHLKKEKVKTRVFDFSVDARLDIVPRDRADMFPVDFSIEASIHQYPLASRWSLWDKYLVPFLNLGSESETLTISVDRFSSDTRPVHLSLDESGHTLYAMPYR